MAHTGEQQTGDRFLVSARKYRPQTFADVVAQEHVTATLRNAIRHDRLAHAYLFSGPRGVGKTTAARLLAKAINCQTPLEEREDAEPCRRCTSCQAFEAGRDLNVIEIDAASNNSVNDIRELRDTVRIPPQGARKKVYILDEVHMLSTAAFNAFLKTLEEPPDHALFIFATTEPHKVLPTILSRCQRFDFRRISVDETVAHLREICDSEGVAADDRALHLIARKGDGALRDALSLFDQAVALCGRELRHDDLAAALGVVDADLFFEVTEAVATRRSPALLAVVGRVVERGYDHAEFLAGLVEHLRNLYVAAATGATDLIETDAETRSRYAAAARDHSEAGLMRAMMVVDEAERRLRTSPQPRLTVEMALLRLAHLEPVEDLKELIARLEGLGEGALAQAAPPAGRPRDAAAPTQAASPERPPPRVQPTQRETDSPPQPPTPVSGDDDRHPPPSPTPPSSPPAPTGADASVPEPADLFGRPALPRRPRVEHDGPTSIVASPGDAEVEDQVALTSSVDRIRQVWPQLVELVRQESTSVATLLERSSAEAPRRGALTITVPDEFAREVLKREGELFARALRSALGEEPPAFDLEIGQNDPETAHEEDPFDTLKRLRHEHPILRLIFDRFGAEIVWT